MKIAIFYHCLTHLGDPPKLLPAATSIITGQMRLLKGSGLLDEADEFHVGINGGVESEPFVKSILPAKAQVAYHGLQSRNECSTIRMIEEWLPDSDGWYVLYFHSKGGTKPAGDPHSTRWRGCMMKHLVQNWRRCVADLAKVESVGCHFMTGDQTPPGQSIWAGNFWFSRASYLRTLPSIMERDRIKMSGIHALDSRYESEVWHFNGPRLPSLIDYHGPRWSPARLGECHP